MFAINSLIRQNELSYKFMTNRLVHYCLTIDNFRDPLIVSSWSAEISVMDACV